MDDRKYSYAPESVEEEYAFLAGRVAALDGYFKVKGNMIVDAEIIKAILGIVEEEKDGRS